MDITPGIGERILVFTRLLGFAAVFKFADEFEPGAGPDAVELFVFGVNLRVGVVVIILSHFIDLLN